VGATSMHAHASRTCHDMAKATPALAKSRAKLAHSEVAGVAPLPPARMGDKQLQTKTPAEFFAENRNIAGFDNVRVALGSSHHGSKLA
jgi:hypothetical protein